MTVPSVEVKSMASTSSESVLTKRYSEAYEENTDEGAALEKSQEVDGEEDADIVEDVDGAEAAHRLRELGLSLRNYTLPGCHCARWVLCLCCGRSKIILQLQDWKCLRFVFLSWLPGGK